jgi:dihydroorotate dehydrogenase (NAD+) catalytic subunit
VVTKSISLRAREGYPNPTVIELEHGLLNCIGLENPGIDAYGEVLGAFAKRKVPVICSIFGSSKEEFAEVAGKAEDYGAHGIELNLSCPHVVGCGLALAKDSAEVRRLVSAVKAVVSVPVFAKLSAEMNLRAVAEAVCAGGADAIVVTNTLRAMAISVDLRYPVLSNKIGGYSGPAIKPVGVRCVYELYETVDVPLVGVGGISTTEDVLEYLLAGACAVQIGSGVYYKGLGIFRELAKGLRGWLSENQCRLQEIVGAAHGTFFGLAKKVHQKTNLGLIFGQVVSGSGDCADGGTW